MKTETGSGNNSVVFDYQIADDPRKAELAELVRGMSWKRCPDDDWEDGSCHFCHGHLDSPTKVQTKEPYYTLQAGEHDSWCPYPRLVALLQSLGVIEATR